MDICGQGFYLKVDSEYCLSRHNDNCIFGIKMLLTQAQKVAALRCSTPSGVNGTGGHRPLLTGKQSHISIKSDKHCQNHTQRKSGMLHVNVRIV